MMVQQHYTLSFITPAFLGNAEQQGQWRTPPFKALLRQWWRVAAAKSHDYNHERLREAEGRLFGNAWIENDFRKSEVRLRLDAWDMGRLSSNAWPGGSIENVVTTHDGRSRVRADVYMGYGPVMPPSRQENRPHITIRNAIDPKDSKNLYLGFENNLQDDIFETLQLIQWFGSLGSRSRNGWGSIMLESAQENTPSLSILPKFDSLVLNRICRPWRQCLGESWPHALGTESDNPLVWITEEKPDWRTVMGCLANIKIEVRHIAKAFQGPIGIGGIHFLGYPAGGKWELKKFGKEARLASQIRFKVLKINNGFIGLIFHFPCKFPDELKIKLDDKQAKWINENEHLVWEKIHGNLRKNNRLKPLF